MTQLSLPLRPTRQGRGLRAYLSGASAESAVARHCMRQGYDLLAEPWQGRGGEIDLILKDGEIFVFCEVKKARSFESALNSLREAQMQRIHAAASEYLEHTPKGQLSDVRFDLALVNVAGEIRIVENAFSHF